MVATQAGMAQNGRCKTRSEMAQQCQTARNQHVLDEKDRAGSTLILGERGSLADDGAVRGEPNIT